MLILFSNEKNLITRFCVWLLVSLSGYALLKMLEFNYAAAIILSWVPGGEMAGWEMTDVSLFYLWPAL